jgi:hypothetical protein
LQRPGSIEYVEAEAQKQQEEDYGADAIAKHQNRLERRDVSSYQGVRIITAGPFWQAVLTIADERGSFTEL